MTIIYGQLLLFTNMFNFDLFLKKRASRHTPFKKVNVNLFHKLHRGSPRKPNFSLKVSMERPISHRLHYNQWHGLTFAASLSTSLTVCVISWKRRTVNLRSCKTSLDKPWLGQILVFRLQLDPHKALATSWERLTSASVYWIRGT